MLKNLTGYLKRLKMQYRTEKFLIIKNMKKFILGLETMLTNFPRKDFLNKDMIYKDALRVLELVYIANEVDDLKRKKDFQIEIISKLNMLDFYLERAYKKKYINEKQCLAKSNELEVISRMVYKWIKNSLTENKSNE